MSAPERSEAVRRNRRVALTCAAVVAGMTGLAFASAPLYDLFCRVTGFGGTPLRAESLPRNLDPSERTITVRFNANIGGQDMPWRFQPVQREVKVRPGEEMLVFYRASNPTGQAVSGQATFNVTPEKAGQYFNKIACFCFEEQKLEAGQSVDMPVSFFVDPAILSDPKTRDVSTITLSYTFFRKPEEVKRVSDRGSAARPVN
jgi:cytochrome c oxidase assembly protein subunit 11